MIRVAGSVQKRGGLQVKVLRERMISLYFQWVHLSL
jgi:hypothetical protein